MKQLASSTLLIWSIRISVFALFFVATGIPRTAAADVCGSGTNLNYFQTVDAYAHGTLTVQFTTNYLLNRTTATITNHTNCGVPLSFASYKMSIDYSPETLSQQIFFYGTPTITVAASSTATLTVTVPLCMTQYDLWYGDVQKVLVDNQVYGAFIAGDHIREGQYCPKSLSGSVISPTISPSTLVGSVAVPPPPPATGNTGGGGGGYYPPPVPGITATVQSVPPTIPPTIVPTPTYPSFPSSGFPPRNQTLPVQTIFLATLLAAIGISFGIRIHLKVRQS